MATLCISSLSQKRVQLCLANTLNNVQFYTNILEEIASTIKFFYMPVPIGIGPFGCDDSIILTVAFKSLQMVLKSVFFCFKSSRTTCIKLAEIVCFRV